TPKSTFPTAPPRPRSTTQRIPKGHDHTFFVPHKVSPTPSPCSIAEARHLARQDSPASTASSRAQARLPVRCPGASSARWRFDEQPQHLADGSFSSDPISQGHVPLNLVAVPPAVLLLCDVARFGEIGDD